MDKDSPGNITNFFAELEDPRLERHRAHKLVDIISITILASICGAEHWTTIEEFGEAKILWLKTFLDLPNGIPSHDTFGRVFALLNPKNFGECFLNWMKSLHEKTSGDVIALDGKTIRGSFDKSMGKTAIHMVSAWSAKNGVVLGQRKVDDKSNEITAIPKLLELLDMTGATITIDAMGCQKTIAQKIIDGGGDYILSLKANHTGFHGEVILEFDGAEPAILDKKSADKFQTTDGGHGRVEVRQYWVMSDLQLFSGANEWPGLKAIGIVDRARDLGSHQQHERQYYLLSEMSSAQKFANSVRSHWSVENDLHWRLDVTFNEDQCRVRIGNAAEIFLPLEKLP